MFGPTVHLSIQVYYMSWTLDLLCALIYAYSMFWYLDQLCALAFKPLCVLQG